MIYSGDQSKLARRLRAVLATAAVNPEKRCGHARFSLVAAVIVRCSCLPLSDRAGVMRTTGGLHEMLSLVTIQPSVVGFILPIDRAR